MIDTFAKAPDTFLADHAVIVADQAEGTSSSVAEFYMQAKSGNAVFLKRKSFLMPKGTATLRAYWLPWNGKGGVSCDLGTGDSDPEWLFTSEMTNCRFSILEGGSTFKVAHVSGTLSQQQRDKWETEHFLPKESPASRRLSVHGNDIQYRGQDGSDKSSAFVFGQRTGTSWRFYAQIIKGSWGGTEINTLPSSLDIITTIARI